MSFHEKSAWACLLGLGAVYIPYFSMVFWYPMAGLGLIWVSAFVLVAILVAFHAINAIVTKSIRSTAAVPSLDELDQRIELNAAKWAGLVLSIAVVLWIFVAMYSAPAIGGNPLEQVKLGAGEKLQLTHSIPLLSVMFAIHGLYAGFVVANVTYYGGIVLGYRRIAGA